MLHFKQKIIFVELKNREELIESKVKSKRNERNIINR